MGMETIIIVIIIVAAGIYLIKTFIANLRRSGQCSCGGGCSTCPPSKSCPEKKTEKNE